MFCCAQVVGVHPVPHSFGRPPPPQVWGAVQVPHWSMPPQPSAIIPQLAPAELQVTWPGQLPSCPPSSAASLASFRSLASLASAGGPPSPPSAFSAPVPEPPVPVPPPCPELLVEALPVVCPPLPDVVPAPPPLPAAARPDPFAPQDAVPSTMAVT
jgi:hypothetical protein